MNETAEKVAGSELRAFVTESNRIEGILRAPTEAELAAHERFIFLPRVSVRTLCDLVDVCAPGHRLRDKRGLNVRVGSYIAPPGGPDIRDRLEALLARMESGSAYHTHVAYETLHPFTDGNGRSGRALWLWQKRAIGEMYEWQQAVQLGFLHTFYYETLHNSSERKVPPHD